MNLYDSLMSLEMHSIVAIHQLSAASALADEIVLNKILQVWMTFLSFQEKKEKFVVHGNK